MRVCDDCQRGLNERKIINNQVRVRGGVGRANADHSTNDTVEVEGLINN